MNGEKQLELYEKMAALAEDLPSDKREMLADLLDDMTRIGGIERTDAVVRVTRRWLRDGGWAR